LNAGFNNIASWETVVQTEVLVRELASCTALDKVAWGAVAELSDVDALSTLRVFEFDSALVNSHTCWVRPPDSDVPVALIDDWFINRFGATINGCCFDSNLRSENFIRSQVACHIKTAENDTKSPKEE
jgi:hypothetical protein